MLRLFGLLISHVGAELFSHLGYPLSLGIQGRRSSQLAPCWACRESSRESEHLCSGVRKMKTWPEIWSEMRDNDRYRSHLCVVVEATEKGCVEHKYSAQKFLVETKVPNLGENAVFGHGAVLWKILISGKDFYLWRWKVSFIVGSCCQLENILKTDLIRRQSWIVGCNDDIPVLYCTLGWGGGGEFSDRNFLWFAQRPGNQELLRHTDTAHHITVTLPR